jgi:MFS superfamily sulfate permease-like transporter
MNGIALTVLISQLPKMLGFSVEDSGPLRKLFAIAQAVLQGKTNWTAFAVGAGTLAVILLLKGRKRVPGILIAVVGATALVGGLNLTTRAGVPVIGSLPQGCLRSRYRGSRTATSCLWSSVVVPLRS